jgi:hypothetical protein
MKTCFLIALAVASISVGGAGVFILWLWFGLGTLILLCSERTELLRAIFYTAKHGPTPDKKGNSSRYT